MVKHKRKSPRRHSVKSHVRSGYRVSSYVRGQGKTIPTLTRRKIIKTGEPKPYTINFVYSRRKGDGESVIVISTSYEKALKEANEERVQKHRTPVEVEIIDPNIGRMLHIVAEGAKTAVKIGAREAGKLTKLGIKYGYAGAKVLGKEAAYAIARAYRSQKLRRLIEECYSPDRATRAMARAKLRTQYPEIYSACDFSREKVSPSTIGRRQTWVRRTKAYY